MGYSPWGRKELNTAEPSTAAALIQIISNITLSIFNRKRILKSPFLHNQQICEYTSRDESLPSVSK